MNKEKVCAVVVSYNRKELLIECLDALRKQTRPLDAIYIIDNASSDGTPETLKEKDYIKEQPPENLTKPWEKEFEIKNSVSKEPIKIHYVRMHKNTGGAGGFYEGVKRAYEKGYDWIWLMDDDVEPNIDNLEKFLYYSLCSMCILGSKYYTDGEEEKWNAFISPTTGKRIEIPTFNKKTYCTNTVCFEGMFIHRTLIDKVGFPDKRFFIVYDDTSYGLLISKYENILVVKDIKLWKKIKKDNKVPSPSFIYYSMRNYRLRQNYVQEVYGNSLLKQTFPYIVFIGYLYRILFFFPNKKTYIKNLIKGFIDSFKFGG